jgi:type II secretory pathway pseudopilin PulG
MAKAFRLTRALLLTRFVVSAAACAAPATPPQTQATNAPAAAQATAAAQPAQQGALTDVGTPRSETLIVQTFDGKTDNPDNMNPLSGSYAIWRGFRELAGGWPDWAGTS